MLTEDQRREIIWLIKLHLRENEGREEIISDSVKKYSLGLPLCSVSITLAEKVDFTPIVEIQENFGRPNLASLDDRAKSFEGLRLLFRGHINGLDEVMLSGVYIPLQDGSSLLSSEKILFTRDERKPDLYDANFDSYLMYISKELGFNLSE